MDIRIKQWIERAEACGEDKEAKRAVFEEIAEEAKRAGLAAALLEEFRLQAKAAALDYGVSRADFALRYGPYPEGE